MNKQNKTIIVTGGAGFIGSQVVKKLLQDHPQHRVIVVDNLSVGRLENLQNVMEKISFHQVDIRNQNALDPLFQGCDYVIHLAANVSIQISINDPLYSESVNITGFLTILELCKKYKIRHLVYASSAAVYGESTTTLQEEANLAPISPYGFEKMSNEYYASFYQKHHGLTSSGLRYFNVYGPGNNKSSDYSGVIKIFIDQINNSQTITIYGDGQQSRDFIFVNDIAAITVKTLFAGAPGIFNVATGKSISILELAQIMQEIAGKKVPINFFPQRPSDILHSRAEVSKIKKILPDFVPTDIRSGLNQTIKSI